LLNHSHWHWCNKKSIWKGILEGFLLQSIFNCVSHQPSKIVGEFIDFPTPLVSSRLETDISCKSRNRRSSLACRLSSNRSLPPRHALRFKSEGKLCACGRFMIDCIMCAGSFVSIQSRWFSTPHAVVKLQMISFIMTSDYPRYLACRQQISHAQSEICAIHHQFMENISSIYRKMRLNENFNFGRCYKKIFSNNICKVNKMQRIFFCWWQ
jgi:hypothetical protein